MEYGQCGVCHRRDGNPMHSSNGTEGEILVCCCSYCRLKEYFLEEVALNWVLLDQSEQADAAGSAFLTEETT